MQNLLGTGLRSLRKGAGRRQRQLCAAIQPGNQKKTVISYQQTQAAGPNVCLYCPALEEAEGQDGQAPELRIPDPQLRA